MRGDDWQAVGAIMVMKAALTLTPLCCATYFAFGFVGYEFVKSPDFIKFLCVLITAIVAGANAWNNQEVKELRKGLTAKDERLLAQDRDLAAFRAMAEDHDAQIKYATAERLKMQVEMAQFSADRLRQMGTFRHSGIRTPIRPSVPPDAAEVLIVDDDAATLLTLGRLFEFFGLAVTSSRSPAAALDLIRARAAVGRRFHYVLLDLVFPGGKTGVDVIESLHDDPAGRGTAAVVMTGNPDAALHARCLAAGARAVLVKPVDPDELLSRLGVDPGRPPVTTATLVTLALPAPPAEGGPLRVVRPDEPAPPG